MKKIIAILLAALLLVMLAMPALADTYVADCPKCEKKTTWWDCCTGKSAGNSDYGSHETSTGAMCNTYYAYMYGGRKCRVCGNVYTFTVKHVHTWKHTICVDQNWCPY